MCCMKKSFPDPYHQPLHPSCLFLHQHGAFQRASHRSALSDLFYMIYFSGPFRIPSFLSYICKQTKTSAFVLDILIQLTFLSYRLKQSGLLKTLRLLSDPTLFFIPILSDQASLMCDLLEHFFSQLVCAVFFFYRQLRFCRTLF